MKKEEDGQREEKMSEKLQEQQKEQELEITRAPEIFIRIERGGAREQEGELQCLIEAQLTPHWSLEPPNRK